MRERREENSAAHVGMPPMRCNDKMAIGRRALYEGENETYIEASAENSGSILYDKEIRDKPRTRRTKRNV